MLVAAMTGVELNQLPDYENSEEEYDAQAIEDALMASPLVRHAPPPPSEEG